jgi:hypothetical protein
VVSFDVFVKSGLPPSPYYYLPDVLLGPDREVYYLTAVVEKAAG